MGSALPREERTICWKSVRSPALAEFIDAADTALAGFEAGRVLVSSSTMVGEGGEACAPAGVCPSTGIWVGGEVCIPAAFGRSCATARGEAVRAVTDSTTTAAKSFQKFRRFAFSFGRAFNLGLPKTQVGSCTKWLLDEANQQPRGISAWSREKFCGDLVAMGKPARRNRLAESVQPELSVGWSRIASVPRQVASSKEVVQVLVSAHRACQPERGDRGFEIANYAARRAPAEVVIHRVEDRSQMFAKHPVRARQFKPGDIQKPHQFRMLRHILH